MTTTRRLAAILAADIEGYSPIDAITDAGYEPARGALTRAMSNRRTTCSA